MDTKNGVVIPASDIGAPCESLTKDRRLTKVSLESRPRWYHRGLHQTGFRGRSDTDDPPENRQNCRYFTLRHANAEWAIWARLGSNQRPLACEAGAEGDWRRLEATVERFRALRLDLLVEVA
jgi:hypothetical protein